MKQATIFTVVVAAILTFANQVSGLKCYNCTDVGNCNTGMCDDGTQCTKLESVISGKSTVTKGCSTTVATGCAGTTIGGFGGTACSCNTEYCNESSRTLLVSPFVLALAVIFVIFRRT